jgi:hypothetical protein
MLDAPAEGTPDGAIERGTVPVGVQWARYQVERARVICGDAAPIGVWLDGTVQLRAANGRPTPDDITGTQDFTMTFTVWVPPDTEIEECL